MRCRNPCKVFNETPELVGRSSPGGPGRVLGHSARHPPARVACHTPRGPTRAHFCRLPGQPAPPYPIRPAGDVEREELQAEYRPAIRGAGPLEPVLQLGEASPVVDLLEMGHEVAEGEPRIGEHARIQV